MVPPDLLRGDHSKREVYMCDMLATTSYLEQDNMVDVSIHGSRVTHICTNEECHDCLSSVWFQDNTRPTADVLSLGLYKTALTIGSTYSTFLSRQWVKKKLSTGLLPLCSEFNLLQNTTSDLNLL